LLLLNERLFDLALGGQANRKTFLRNLSVRIERELEAVKFLFGGELNP